jgi:hypothetical protein
MSLITFPGGLTTTINRIQNETSDLLNASGEEFCMVFQIPKTGTIDRIVFQTANVTTGDDILVEIEAVNTSGYASGTAYGGMVGGVVTVGSGDDDTSKEATLSTPCSATKNDWVAVRLSFNSYVSGNLEIASLSFTKNTAPAVWLDSGSGFAIQDSGQPSLALRYDDGSYVVPYGCAPPSNIGTTIIDSPEKCGHLFQFPVPITVGGVSFLLRELGSTQEIDFEIISDPLGTPVVEESITITHDYISGTVQEMVFFQLPDFDCAANTDYAIVCAPQGTDDVRVYTLETGNANYFGGYAGGSNVRHCLNTSGSGAFTETTTKKVVGGIHLSRIHNGSGGGNSNFLRGKLA